jgi:hypothetical protein
MKYFFSLTIHLALLGQRNVRGSDELDMQLRYVIQGIRAEICKGNLLVDATCEILSAVALKKL